MMHRTMWGLAIASVLLATQVGAAEMPAIRWEPYTYETRTGETITDGELGHLTVPERHDDPEGATLELAFVRFRSTAETPGPPIIWLAGGPGDHGTDDIEGPYLALVREFQSAGDVIALDQRGTGLSRPLLTCPPDNAVQLPLDVAVGPDDILDAYRRSARECIENVTDLGIDLSAYNTVESAHDVDALRRALGVERVGLYGASYGTHLALAVLRYHGDGVDRVILSGVEGPDHTWKLPSNIDAHFARVAAAARADSAVAAHYPDLEHMMRTVLDRLEAEPITIEVPAEGDRPARELVVGAWDLRRALGAFLGSRRNIARLPAIMAELYRGEFGEVAEYLASLRTVRAWSAMYYCMDCASGASPQRLARIEREAPTSLTGIVDWPAPAICTLWPHAELDERFRSPVHSSRPTLFLSGTLDGHTPPSNAAEVMRTFTDAVHVVVEGGSHQQLELDLPEVTRLLGAFMRGEEVTRTRFRDPLMFEVSDDTEDEGS
jgi:pimeloyl-ACP methyl ester carboxylesterase